MQLKTSNMLTQPLPEGLRGLVAVILLLAGASVTAEEWSTQHERLRVLPGSVPAAGYFTLENRSPAEIELVGAESPAYDRIELHRSIREDGMSRMERVSGIELAPGERIEFVPGGYHLMLFDPRQPLSPGDQVDITLHLESQQAITRSFRVMEISEQ